MGTPGATARAAAPAPGHGTKPSGRHQCGYDDMTGSWLGEVAPDACAMPMLVGDDDVHVEWAPDPGRCQPTRRSGGDQAAVDRGANAEDEARSGAAQPPFMS